MSLGNKANNILTLKNNIFYIPKTIIFKQNNIDKGDLLNFLENNKKYIIRPSFEGEDGRKSSFAGFYKSIFPLTKIEVLDFFKNKNFETKFGGNSKFLKSIVIQEFIETNIYGVYFSRNPENIFLKGFYEISNKNNGITNGNDILNKKLNFDFEKELKIIGDKLENIFHFPQDIEFCIKNKKIVLLQSRNITTGIFSNYNFDKIKKFNGIYQKLDFDEIGDIPDYFTYIILNKIFDSIFINGGIYFKKTLFIKIFFLNLKNIKNNNLKLFLNYYKKYLIQKFYYNLLKIIIPQKLDKKILINFFKDYKYSFNLNIKSNLNINFNFQTNFITKYFLKTEKIKNLAFFFLENYKKEFDKNIYFLNENFSPENKLFFYKGILFETNQKKEDFKFIFKGKIQGKLTNLKNFNKKNKNQILFVENLDFYIFDKIENISGIIIKNGNLLSHNSIILREYKIPSIIQYKDFNKLKNGNFIEII